MFLVFRVLYFIYVVSLSFLFFFLHSIFVLWILCLLFSEDIGDSSFPFLKKVYFLHGHHFLQVAFFLSVCLFAFLLSSMSFFDILWCLKFMSGAPATDCKLWEKGFGLSTVVSSVGVFWLGCIFGKIPGISSFRSFLLCLSEAPENFQFSYLDCWFLAACNLGTSGRSDLDGQHSIHAPVFRMMHLSWGEVKWSCSVVYDSLRPHGL